MELFDGVPVWHASVSNGRLISTWSRNDRRMALRHVVDALRGVGRPSRQWVENGSIALHVRRRVKPSELAVIGEARDIRDTDEQRQRIDVVLGEVSPMVRTMLEANL